MVDPPRAFGKKLVYDLRGDDMVEATESSPT